MLETRDITIYEHGDDYHGLHGVEKLSLLFHMTLVTLSREALALNDCLDRDYCTQDVIVAVSTPRRKARSKSRPHPCFQSTGLKTIQRDKLCPTSCSPSCISKHTRSSVLGSRDGVTPGRGTFQVRESPTRREAGRKQPAVSTWSTLFGSL